MTDAIVVGAGFAGMVAARELIQQGYSVKVLEARERVGGRVKAGSVAGVSVDFGGTWRGHTQTALDQLAGQLGVLTFPQYASGRRVLEFRGRRRTYKGLIPPIGLRAALDTATMLSRLNKMAQLLPPEAPWQAKEAKSWDRQTLADWQQQVRSEGARSMLEVATRAVLCAEPRDVSLLYFLSYIRAAGSIERLLDVRNGGQQDRMVGGMHGLAQKLGDTLGEAIVLSTPVKAIAQGPDSVTVYAQGQSWPASYVVVAVPPALVAEIEFSPALPEKRQKLQTSMPMGSVIKCFASYPKPFWREQGLSGEAVSEGAVVSPVFDASPQDGSIGILVGFMDGDAAKKWSSKSQEARRQVFLQDMARFFGPEAAHPTDYTDCDWLAEPWSRGCYVGYMPPEVMTRYGEALREPVGRIHWAGTETATVWTGYVDGAIRSGQRAAREVIERLL